MTSPRDAANFSDETQPLLRPMTQNSVGTLCIFAVASFLTFGWCLMDGWNHDVSNQLFGISEVKKMEVAPTRDIINTNPSRFDAPFLLAYLQFGFMGLLFSILFFFLTPTAPMELGALRHSGSVWRWAILIVTHVFSVFWLQALILPKQSMSLGLFAASRSLEVIAAAGFRAKVFNTRPDRRELATPFLMFAAAWLLYYSYSQLSQCLCIWSGNGVELTGPSLAIVYVLVLTIPAANFVTQESVMTHLEIKPLLLLAAMNVGALVASTPLLLVAHLASWEDFGAASRLITTYPQVYMLILWLCVQMAASSGFSVALIYTVNSFWAVSLRSLRVVFWWCRVLCIFYFTSGADLLSTSLPNESYWSFVMFCGLAFMAAAICAETRSEAVLENEKKPATEKKIIRSSKLAGEAAIPAAIASPQNVPPPPAPYTAEKV
jgi:hypothetical protein